MPTSISEMPDLMTPADVSKALNVPVGTLGYWRSVGEGPKFLRLGGRVIRYRKSDMLEWLNSRICTSTAKVSE